MKFLKSILTGGNDRDGLTGFVNLFARTEINSWESPYIGALNGIFFV